MFHAPRHTVLVLAVLFLTASVSCAVTGEGDAWEEPATCDGVVDDCVPGYTSLLQESMKLSGHAIHQHAHAGRSRHGKHKHKLFPHGAHALVDSQGRYTASSGLEMGMKKVGVVCGIAAFALLVFVVVIKPALSSAPMSDQQESDAEEVNRIHDHFNEDTYSLTIGLLVRDLRLLAVGEGKPDLKVSRMGFAMALVLLTIGAQIGLLVCTKQFVTPNQVADIREAYDRYEQVMYNNHTYLNVNGKQRGYEGYFNASAFDQLSDDEKMAACNIPFSQVNFLCIILVVWTITCCANMKTSLETFMTLVFFTETKDDMKDCLLHWTDAAALGDDDAGSEKGKHPAHSAPVMVIVGLTKQLKVFLSLFVFLPEFATTVYLLWLGCRWLTATNEFGDIVQNAVALEFILQLKYLLFAAFASERNKRDLTNTAMAPPWKKESAGFGVYFHSLFWLALSFFWVWYYVFHFQKVLPDYHWDVHQVCNDWLINIIQNSGGDDD